VVAELLGQKGADKGTDVVRDYLIGYRSNYQAGKRVAMETAATRDTGMIIIIPRQRREMIGNKSAYCPQNARLHIKRLMMVEPGKELIKQPCDDGWCQTLERLVNSSQRVFPLARK
jgi:nickel-dependent lactate racemase